MSTERPILFSALMVRAILDGRKTQTRRPLYVLKRATRYSAIDQRYEPPRVNITPTGFPDTPVGKCWQLSDWRKVKPGDRLWVRETWCVNPRRHFGVDAAGPEHCLYRADDNSAPWQWTPSIHMPRKASRITLEVTGVLVERLQDISADNILKEGCCQPNICGGERDMLRDEYWRPLWVSINGADSWAANPWVWCIEFKRVTP